MVKCSRCKEEITGKVTYFWAKALCTRCYNKAKVRSQLGKTVRCTRKRKYWKDYEKFKEDFKSGNW